MNYLKSALTLSSFPPQTFSLLCGYDESRYIRRQLLSHPTTTVGLLLQRWSVGLSRLALPFVCLRLLRQPVHQVKQTHTQRNQSVVLRYDLHSLICCCLESSLDLLSFFPVTCPFCALLTRCRSPFFFCWLNLDHQLLELCFDLLPVNFGLCLICSLFTVALVGLHPI